MDSASSGILPDLSGEPDAAALARLREQRWRLGLVLDGVAAMDRRLAGQEVDAAWRSPAQRAYGERLAELSRGLQGAWRVLDDALSAVDVAIDRAKAAAL